MILIAGATGSNGKELVKVLASRGIPLRALVRPHANSMAISNLEGVELVRGDLDDPGSIERALHGIEKAFLLTNSTERTEVQQLGFVQTAKRSGLRHIVKLSQLGASEASPVRFLRVHAAVERAIRESGIAYTFLRPNLYMQGLLAFGGSIRTSGKFYAAAGQARVSVVDIRDNAAVAAAALTETRHEGKIYTLTGPQALSHADMAAKFSAVLGRTITFVDVQDEAMKQFLLQAGFPAWQADGLIEDYAHYRRNEASDVSPDVERVIGKRPRSFSQFAQDYASSFS